MVFAGLCGLFLAGVALLFETAWQAGYGLRWALQASGVVLYVLGVLWRGLAANHRLGEAALLPGLGWGNALTLLRGVLVAGLVGFLFLPEPAGWLAWIPGIFYTVANATDFFDGYLARKTNHVTRLGELLDMSLDGLGVLVAVALAVQYGRLPAWYLLVGLARYLFLVGLWLRRRRNQPVYDLPSSVARRVLAGFQMGFLAVMLWPLFGPPGTFLAAALFGIPFLIGFGRDWLFVAGILQPQESALNRWLALLSAWLSLLLRLAVAALQAGPLLERYARFPGLPALVLGVTILETLCLVLLLLGVLSRVTAILALILLGINQLLAPLSLAQMLLAAVYTGILFLGPGAYALWKPEEYLVYHRAGERSRKTGS